MNYIVATALHQGFVGLDDFTAAALTCRKICETAKKVKTYSTKEWNDLYPDIRGAQVFITTKDGKVYSEKTNVLSGMGGDHEEVKRKFNNACKNGFTPEHANKILEYVAGIDSRSDITEMLSLCNAKSV